MKKIGASVQSIFTKGLRDVEDNLAGFRANRRQLRAQLTAGDKTAEEVVDEVGVRVGGGGAEIWGGVGRREEKRAVNGCGVCRNREEYRGAQ